MSIRRYRVTFKRDRLTNYLFFFSVRLLSFRAKAESGESDAKREEEESNGEEESDDTEAVETRDGRSKASRRYRRSSPAVTTIISRSMRGGSDQVVVHSLQVTL